jgi:hypothetical protein
MELSKGDFVECVADTGAEISALTGETVTLVFGCKYEVDEVYPNLVSLKEVPGRWSKSRFKKVEKLLTQSDIKVDQVVEVLHNNAWRKGIILYTQQSNCMVEVAETEYCAKEVKRFEYKDIRLSKEADKVVDPLQRNDMNPGKPVEHRVKSHIGKNFDDLRCGLTLCNVRKNDRNYRVGDSIIFEEYKPMPDCKENKGWWSGHCVRAKIINLIGDNCPGIQTGYCVLSLEIKHGTYHFRDESLAGKYDLR